MAAGRRRGALALTSLLTALTGAVTPGALPARAATPNFTMSCPAAQPSAPAGGTVTMTITVTGMNGETGSISLVPEEDLPVIPAHGAWMPAAQSVQLSPTAPSATATFTLSTTTAALQGSTWNFLALGADASGNRQTSPDCQYTIGPPGDLALSVSPPSITVSRGGLGQASVTVAPINGFDSEVDLAATTTPPPATAAEAVVPVATWGAAPATTVSPPYPTQVLSVTVSPETSAGTYSIVVEGTSPGHAASTTQSTTLTVNVVTSGQSDFQLSASACPSFSPGASSQFGVTVTGTGGEDLPITLTSTEGKMQAVPPAAAFSGPPYGTQTFTVSQSAKLAATSQQFTIVGVDADGFTHAAQTTCASSTAPADFALAPSQTTVSVVQGSSVGDSIGITAVNGMSSPIQMTAALTTVPGTTGAEPIASWAGTSAPVANVASPYPTQQLTVAASQEVPIGTYTIRVDATSDNAASVEQTVNLTVNVVAGTGDFTMSVGSGPTLNPGASGTFTVAVTPVGAESVPITLVPSEGPGTLSPPVAVLQPPFATGQTITQTFTVSANAHVPAGQYPIDVAAVDGHGFSWTGSTTATVTTSAADFSIIPSPSRISVAQTRTAALGVAINPVNGMHDDIQLSVARGADNATVAAPTPSWSNGTPAIDVPSSGGVYTTQTLSFSALASAPQGTYHYVVTATSTNSATPSMAQDVFVTVISGAPDFAVSFSSAPTFNPGTSASITATVSAINGDPEPVTLVPDQGTVTVSPSSVTVNPGAGATFQLSAIANAAACSPCAFTLTAIGQQTGQAHRPTGQYTLTSTPAGYSITASPASQTITAGTSWTTRVTVQPTNGMSGTVGLVVVPAADTANAGRTMPIATWTGTSFSDTPTGTPVATLNFPAGGAFQQALLTFTDPPSDSGGAYHYQVVGLGSDANPATVTANVDVTVVVPSFTLSASAMPSINPGSSQSFTVTAAAVNGGTSPVTIVPQQAVVNGGNSPLFPVPTVAVATVTPAETSFASSSGSAQFSLAVAADTPAGSYSETVTGADQRGHTVQITVPFTVTSTPASFSLTGPSSPTATHPGAAASAAVTVSASNGLAGSVDLAVTPVPALVGAAPPVAAWSGTGTPVITAAPASTQWLNFMVPTTTPPGLYSYQVLGVSPNASPPQQTTFVTLLVEQPATNGFVLNPATGGTFNPGTTHTVSVSIMAGPQESTPITIAAGQGPATVTPATITVLPPYAPVTFFVATPAQQPSGVPFVQTFAAADQSGNVAAATSTYTLSDTPATFGVTASPSTITALAGEVNPATATVVVSPINGFASPVTLAAVPASATPPGIQPVATWASGNSSILTGVPASSAQTLDVVASSSVAPGTYVFDIVGASDNASPPVAITTLSVVVPAPGGSPGAPSVSLLSTPRGSQTGSLNGGDTVTIQGSDFVPDATSVLFGSTPGTQVSVSSPSQLTVVSPATCAGTVDVRVVTPAGASPIVPEDRFTFTGQPSISSISPAVGSASSSATVVVTGSALGCPQAADIGGLGAVGAAVLKDPANPNSPTQVELSVPPQPNGRQGDLHITTAGGSSTSIPADVFTWHAPAPTLSSLSPVSGPSSGGTSVSLTGQFFSFATSVTFGSQPAQFTVKSDTQLTAVAPPGCGAVPVTVTTAAGVSLSATFTYVAGLPSVSTVTPSAGPTAGGNPVVISGANLGCTTTVSFGAAGAPSFHIDSDSQITVTAPGEAPGMVYVVLTNAAGSSPQSPAAQYSYITSPAVSAVVPDAGPLSGGTAVTISGQNFVVGSQVLFGGRPATSVSVQSPTTITAITPSSPTAGQVAVVVNSAGGTSAPANNGSFVYGTPSISSLSPSLGPPDGGNDVRISGANFAPDSAVSFGGQSTPATVISTTLIDVPSAPLGTEGTNIAVTVQDPAGASAPAIYSYAYRPDLTTVSPSSGAAAGGTTVTVTGTGLSGTPQVLFGQILATSVTLNADGTLTAVAPPGTAGTTVDVVVQTVGGQSRLKAADRYTYLVPPTASGVAPSAGPLVGGTHVYISGTGFSGTPTVTFGTTSATGVVLDSSTQIEAVSPATASVGTVTVSVTVSGGTVTAGTFSYDPVPTVSAVSPDAGPAGGGNTVTVTGTGFLHAVTVSFGGVTVVPSTVNQTGTSMTAAVPAQTLAPLNGVVGITVTTAGGSSSPVSAPQYAYGGPSVLAVAPLGGRLSAATPVTITGNGFVPGATVSFGGTLATGVTVVNAQTITAVTPSMNTSGPVDVTVSTAMGLTSPTTVADRFTFGPPQLGSLSPTTGPAAGGQSLTLTVTNMVPEQMTVTIGGAAVSPAYNAAAGTLTITTPPKSTIGSTTVPVTVADDGGTSNTVQYTYWAAPTVASVRLTAGPTTGNRVVTITGGNFVAGDTTVFFGPIGAPQGFNLSVTSPTTLVVTTPPEAAGTVDIRVKSTGGVSAPSTNDQYQFMDLGYWIVESNGTMHSFGAAPYEGGITFALNKPISSMAPTPDGHGYWMTGQDGGVFAFGDAGFFGSMANVRLNAPVVGIVGTPDGGGYWLVGADGGIFTFGDAPFYGGMGNTTLNRPASGIAVAPSGNAYWIVAQDGGIFNFPASAQTFYGSECCLAAPYAYYGIAATLDGGGYWMIRSDGAVARLGDAPGFGDEYGTQLNKPTFAILPTPDQQGYWLIGQDGGVFTFGLGARFLGAATGITATAAAGLFPA